MTEKKKESGEISRRKFLKDAGLVVGGTAIGSTILLAACAGETVTETATKTVTSTAPGTTATTTKTVTVEVPVQLPKAKGFVAYDDSVCSGCGVCNDVCSLYHFGECSPYLAAITLKTNPVDAYYTENETCRQCDAPTCIAACPVEGAMYVDEETGARCIDEEKCIGCGICAEACEYNIDKGDAPPFRENWVGGAEVQKNKIIKLNPETNKYFKCDLCGGEPQCVRLCPMGALSFKEVV